MTFSGEPSGPKNQDDMDYFSSERADFIEEKSDFTATKRPDLKEPLEKLDEYNKYFSPGAVLGRTISAKIDRLKNQDEERQQALKAEELVHDYSAIFDRVGISLERVKSPAIIFSMSEIDNEEVKKEIQKFIEETGITEEDLDDPESYEFKRAQQFIEDLEKKSVKPLGITEMRLNIGNSDRFISYLEFLKENNIRPEEKQSLEKIAGILEQQFLREYDVSDPNDERFLNLIGSLGKIIILCESLGLGDSVKKLNQLLEAAREKYLKEFLLVEREGYLNPHDYGFGPAKWHTDITPDHYDENWSEALKTYQDILKNPNAKELSNKLRDHLLQAVEIATNQIESSAKDGKYEKNNYPKFLKTLAETKKRLISEK